MDEADLTSLLETTFLQDVELLEEIDSTNSYCLRQLNQGITTTPHLVLAKHQTAGRGRRGNQWWSSDGSLMGSLLINFEEQRLRAEHHSRVALIVGLAWVRSLLEVVQESALGLKWPNDIYLSGHKLGGILVEATSEQPQIGVIGFGLNLENDFASAPVKVRERAISLKHHATENGRSISVDRVALLRQWLLHLEQLLQEASHDFQQVLDQWRRYCLLTGNYVEVLSGETLISGTCQGVDDEGGLLIHTISGTQRVTSGTIQRIESGGR